jgi:hypothetical protein
MLMNTDVRDALKKIVVAIGAADPAAGATPQIVALFKTFDEIARVSATLRVQLQATLDAIDSRQPPQLAAVSTLSGLIVDAIAELEAGGGPPGVGDKVR